MVAKAIVEIASETKEFDKGMDKFDQRMKAIGKKVTDTGKQLALKLTAPIVALGGAIINTAMNFSSQMARVQAISGATGDAIGGLTKIAMEMGRGTSFSATQAAEGLEYLAMAGWETSAMIKGLPPILRMAEATQMDLARASDIVSDMMTAFRIEAEHAGKVTDVLAKTATTANTNVDMLGETFKFLAPAAASAGWSLESAAAMAGILANAGLKGSIAGTSLNAMLADLTNTTDAGAKSIKALGVRVYDTNGNMRSAVEILADFEKGLKGKTKEQKDSALADIFNQRSLRGVNLLLAEGSDSLDAYTKQLENSSGAVEEMGKIMRDELAYELKELRSMLEGAAITAGNVLVPMLRQHVMPVLRDLIERLQAAADWFLALEPSMQRTILAGVLLAAALGPVLIIIGQLITAIGAISGAITAVGVKLGILAGPAGWIALAVAAVALLGYAFWQASRDSTEAIRNLEEEALSRFDSLRDGIELSVAENVGKIVESYRGLRDDSIVLFQEMFIRQTAIAEGNWKEVLGKAEKYKADHLALIEKQKAEELALIREALKAGLIQDEAAAKEMFAQVEANFVERKGIVETGFDKIEEILRAAYKDQRALTREELNAIKDIKDEIYKELLDDLQEHTADWIKIETIAYRDLEKLDKKELDKRLETIKGVFGSEITALDANAKEQLDILARLHAAGQLSKEQYAAAIDVVYGKYEQDYRDLAEAEEEITGDILAQKQRLKEGTIRRVNEMAEEVNKRFKSLNRGLVGGSIVPDMIDDIITEFERLDTLSSMARTWGRAIINGFWSGLRSLWQSVKNWFERNVVNTIKKLDPYARFSPSMVEQVHKGLREIERAYQAIDIPEFHVGGGTRLQREQKDINLNLNFQGTPQHVDETTLVAAVVAAIRRPEVLRGLDEANEENVLITARARGVRV